MSDQGPDEVSTTLPDPVHHETLLERQDTTYDWPVIDETSAYSACYTTGTTGRPKGVFYSHRGIVLHTLMWAADQAVTDRDSVLMTTPMFNAQCWGLPQISVQERSQVVLPDRYIAEQRSAEHTSEL